MNKKRLLVSFVLLIWCLIDVMNFIVSLFLYKEGKEVYPIIFWSLYGFEKLLIITVTLIQRPKASLRLALLDTLSFGFLISFFDHTIQVNKVQIVMIIKVINRAMISVIQLVFFFGLGILEDNVGIDIVNLAYASYILYLVMRGIIFEIVQYQGSHQIGLKVFQSVLITLTYQLSLSAMASLEDSHGVNVGYYFIAITLLQQIAFYIKTNVKEVNILKTIATNTFFNTPGFHQVVHVKKWFTIINYLAQLARFVVFVVFAEEIVSSDNQHLVNINNVIVIVLNILYLGFFIKQVIKKIFLIDIIHITDVKGFENTYERFRDKKHYWFSKVHIFFDGDISSEVTRSNFSSPSHEKRRCTNQLCEDYYKFNEIIANTESNHIKFNVQGFNQVYCEYHVLQSLKSIKKVNYWIFFQLYKYINQNCLYPVVLDRYFNGHISNSSNPNIFNHIKTTKEKLIFIQLEQELLQINAFKNNVSTLLINQPELILYDLYAN